MIDIKVVKLEYYLNKSYVMMFEKEFGWNDVWKSWHGWKKCWNGGMDGNVEMVVWMECLNGCCFKENVGKWMVLYKIEME